MMRRPCVPMVSDSFFWYGAVAAVLGFVLLRYLGVL